MNAKTSSSTLLLALVVLFTFPIWIGVLGGLFGLIAGIFGLGIGLIAGLFGTIIGVIGGLFSWLFDWDYGLFNWWPTHFLGSEVVIFVIIILGIALLIKPSRKPS